MRYLRLAMVLVMVALGGCATSRVATESALPMTRQGWLSWRGPLQDGLTGESALPTDLALDGPNVRWTFPIQGRGTPVIAGDHLYVMGYEGKGADLQEFLLCLDLETGKERWRLGFNDYLSDIIYERYSIGAPAVDPETGNVWALTSPGDLVCASPDGEILHKVSLMEQYGRLTFPNGRTGAPAIDGDLVMVNMINSAWGAEGPARNRYYAFDKHTGELAWASTPGVGPPFLRDSSFSVPLFADAPAAAGMPNLRVFYGTTGCGNVVCVNARTGEPLWRYQLAQGGIDSSPVIDTDPVTGANRLIVVHGKENVGDTGRGRLVAMDLDKIFRDWAAATDRQHGEPLVLTRDCEIWRNDKVSMFTSSPIVVDGKVYQVTGTGDLYCVDSATGATLWHEKLGADQLHASPIYGGGKLYIPTWHDGLQVIEPTESGPKVLAKVDLPGELIGSPAAWRGRLYVHSTQALYAFGPKSPGALPMFPARAGAALLTPPISGVATALRVMPGEVLLRPGDTQAFRSVPIDAAGLETAAPSAGPGSEPTPVAWAKWVPPTARVKAELDADLDATTGLLSVATSANQSAGAMRATQGNIAGTTRGRILPDPPYHEDFESFSLTAKDAAGGAFSFPPLPWIGARLKWEIRERDGNKVLVKTLDNILFMRSVVFLGHPEDRNYTVTADIMSDGNRRTMSSVGVINQRYSIALVGNWQILEIVSNHERVKYSVPYKWKAGTWYRLTTRVDPQPDGSAIVRAKVWPRDEPEPAAWTIEMPHTLPHTHGAPGLYGFSPQSQFPVYVDNIHITPNSP